MHKGVVSQGTTSKHYCKPTVFLPAAAHCAVCLAEETRCACTAVRQTMPTAPAAVPGAAAAAARGCCHQVRVMAMSVSFHAQVTAMTTWTQVAPLLPGKPVIDPAVLVACDLAQQIQ